MFSIGQNDKGFTMIELITVMVVLGVISAAVISAGTGWVENWKISGIRQDALSEASSALNRMVREIRCIRNRQSVVADWLLNPADGKWYWYPRCSSTRFAVYDADGIPTDFTYDAPTGVLYRNYNNTGNQPLAMNVTALSFKYFRSDMQELDGHDYWHALYVDPTYTNIRLIRIQLSLSKGGQTVTLRTAVAPMNLQME